MDAETFIRRWERSTLKERSAAQTHFNDLCELLGIKPPVESDPTGEWFGFEMPTRKRGGRRGFADVGRKGHFAWEYKGNRKDLDAALDQLRQYAPALHYPKLLVVSDTKIIRVVTAFNDTAETVYQYELGDLRSPARIEQLRFVFEDPDRLKPGITPAHVTEQAAGKFRVIVDSLRLDGHEPRVAAHFATQLLFCLFAEDIGILKDRAFRETIESSVEDQDRLVPALSELFKQMDRGGLFGAHRIPYFNGRLFEVHDALSLPIEAFTALREAALLTWSEIHPAIFGTLFERGMNPGKTDQVGRHYTEPSKIRQIIEPVIFEPLKVEWQQVASKIKSRVKRGQRNAAQKLYGDFVGRLAKVRVLDPACGSGNFLYLALQGLKDFEHQIGLEAEAQGLEREFPQLDPSILYGIDLDEYAVELARVTIWIGQIQWMKKNGYGPPTEPILPPLENIAYRDALLNPDGSEAEWPEAECIVGNPPFLGDKKMIAELGESQTKILRKVFSGRIPAGSDLVTYWFEKARAQIQCGKSQRTGLVATNSIRGGQNRKVLHRIAADAVIYNAWADEPWILEGAAVRVSIVCFAGMNESIALSKMLNGHPVATINADLTGHESGSEFDLTRAKRLKENEGVCFIGTQKTGPFDIPGQLARQWLRLPQNPNGLPNSVVLRPYLNGMDITRRSTDSWIVDFGPDMSEQEAALFEKPFDYVSSHVQPARRRSRQANLRAFWWRFEKPRPAMRYAIAPLERIIATPAVAKHRIFVWLPTSISPDHQLFVFARNDDVTFGILHSRIHELWALRQGTWLGVGNDPRYTSTTTFETFPFPEGLTLNIPASRYANDSRARAIAQAAKELDRLRGAWLNPPKMIKVTREIVRGYPDRVLPINKFAAAELKARTLTNLYNQRPRWLANAHAAVDEAVANAYGWPVDLREADVLKRLLELNLDRAKAGG
jgi:type II restriction/modification system DNA methylase subunit YeeA